jgi:MoaA/NifB/PqqE/SkfB family radical SAM enzyme
VNIKVFCGFPFNRVRVTAEGNVAMCCFQRQDPLSNKSPYIGNLLHQSFDEIWFSEIAEDIRLKTIDGELHDMCKVPGCPYQYMKAPYPVEDVTYNEYPNFLEIDLPNTHCNIGLSEPNEEHPACIMCERAAPSDIFKPEKDHLKEVLSKLTGIVPNLYQIHIQGIAEPFYKDLIFEILDILKFDDHKEQITISTTTNGTLLNLNRRKEYLKRVPHSITNFSIDASTAETFKKIRILPVFDTVLENLYAFSRERVRARQFLRISNNINSINVHEVVGMVQIAAKANVEYVEFNPTDGFNHKILVNDENCGLFRKAQFDIIEEAKKLKVPYTFIRPLDMGLMDQLVQLTL